MDETQIANLIFRCADYFDAGDFAAAAALFTRAQLCIDKNSDPITHEELLALWEREIIVYADNTPKTKHLISNLNIDINRDTNTAVCHSYFTVIQGTELFAPQIIKSGRYIDSFALTDGAWHFVFRDCSQIDMLGDTKQHLRENTASENTLDESNRNDSKKISPVRAKILAAAQQIFSTAGYSEASMRKIAEVVGVSPTILFRHFNSKAALYEEALIAAMGGPKHPSNREIFGRYVADMLGDPETHISPHAMTVLAIGNEESREIATRVLEEYAIKPMAEWLGEPNAESRARQVMALCAGFVLYYSGFKHRGIKQRDPHMVDWLAQSIQSVVDNEPYQPPN